MSAPSPGKIQQLPVKVLYSIDTSPHSYVTVLNSPQDVYVHFKGRQAENQANGSISDVWLGSCLLKGVARAICYASPECIPNQTNLDFSVYNLDPSQRTPVLRAFTQSDDPSSWNGRGFLSWVLSEPSPGRTTIKGRLTREYEFSSSHLAPEGGMEALIAAANNSQHAEIDGKGWGLEISISLRQVNPEGKVEFKGRKEFEESLTKGVGSAGSPRGGSAGAMGILSSPAGPRTSQPNVARQVPVGLGARNGEPSLVQQMEAVRSQAAGGASGQLAKTQSLGHNASSQAGSSRPSSALGRPSSSSGMPPSSFPGPPSSNGGDPSRRSSAVPQQTLSAPQPPVPAQAQLPLAPPPRTQPTPNPTTSAATTPAESPAVLPPRPTSTCRSRQVTPPPPPRARSPPPSTPSRKHLHALLRADGMMSPELARHLASNPVLRNLLKAVPINSGALAQLRSVAGINAPAGIKPPGGQWFENGRDSTIGKGKGKSAGNGDGNARGQGQSVDGDGDGDGNESPPEPTTPTPSYSQLKTPLIAQPFKRPQPVQSQSSTSGQTPAPSQAESQGQNQPNGQGPDTAGCCNCGTMVSSCWRVRKVKDGPPRKVCDDCGVYFNQHKKMRPPELWNPSGSRSSSTEGKKRQTAAIPIDLDGPAANLRSSPRRLSSHPGPGEGHSLPPGHHHTRSHTSPHHPPSDTSSSSKHPQSRPTQPPPHILPPLTPTTASRLGESPRKKRRGPGGYGPSPSPRMATRLSTRHSAGDMVGEEVFGFSPRTLLGSQSTLSGSGSSSVNGHNTSHGRTATIDEFDLSTFLSSMDHLPPTGHTTHHHLGNGVAPDRNGVGVGDGVGTGDNLGFDLDALFGGPENGEQGGGELSQEILDLLANWEEQGAEGDVVVIGNGTGADGAGAGANAGGEEVEMKG